MRLIAQQAGVSVMTVSRALRDGAGVAPPLHRRIHKIATELGYLPDPEVTRLMRHLRQRNKGKLVACIAAITSIPEEGEPPQLRKVRESARIRAEEHGYRLEIFRVASPERANPRLERTLLSRGIEGVLLLQQSRPLSLQRCLNWDKFAATIASPSVLLPDCPRVGINHFHNARLLCSQLAKAGHTRIGFVGTRSFCQRTNEAFPAATALNGMASGAHPVPPFVFDDEAQLITRLPRWLEQERPEVIILHAESLIAPVTSIMASHKGPQIPLACTSIQAPAPRIPGIDERHELVGELAMDMLANLLCGRPRNRQGTHCSTLVEGLWVDSVAESLVKFDLDETESPLGNRGPV